jgi:hypothetical protein
LANISRLPFYTHTSRHAFREMRSAAVSLIPASLIHPSETFAGQAIEVATELLYQLRWPLGGSCGSRGAIKNVIIQNRGA